MKRYKILKGWHYALILFRRLGGWRYNKKCFYIKFKFSKECWWSPKRNPDDGDLNKLIGLTFGILGIHKNSLRLAWRPDFDEEGMIEIYGYVHDKKGKYVYKQYITTVSVDEPHFATFNIYPDKYTINVNYDLIVMGNTNPDKKIQKTVYPYFGGDNAAPQTMIIEAKLVAVK